MPFGPTPSNDTNFPIETVLRDPRWVLIPDDRAGRSRTIADAGRMIRNSLRFYAANSERLYSFDEREELEKVLSTYGRQVLKVLDRVTKGNTNTPLHDAISALAGDREDHLTTFHISLRSVLRGLELSASASRAVQSIQASDRAGASRRQRTHTSAKKAVAKMEDPLGHLLAYRLIPPFILLSDKDPSGAPQGLFAAYVGAVEAAFLDRLTTRIREEDASVSDSEVQLQVSKHRICDLKEAVRWAVGEWRADTAQT